MTKTKLAILGANGLLGTRFQHYFGRDDAFQLFPLAHADADVTDVAGLNKALAAVKPDWVINCTAFLNTDRCEREPDNSYKVNVTGATNAAHAAKNIGAGFIHFSTDYVFDGKEGNYSENSMAKPLSYYGLHKYLADEAILASGANAYILRVASIMGTGIGRTDIVQTLLNRVAKGADKLEVVDDLKISISTPQFIARAVRTMITKKPAIGLYNTVADGQTTWLDAAREAFAALDVPMEFGVLDPAKFPRPTPRPEKSWLNTSKLAGVMAVPTWQDVIREQMAEMREPYRALLQTAKAA